MRTKRRVWLSGILADAHWAVNSYADGATKLFSAINSEGGFIAVNYDDLTDIAIGKDHEVGDVAYTAERMRNWLERLDEREKRALSGERPTTAPASARLVGFRLSSVHAHDCVRVIPEWI